MSVRALRRGGLAASRVSATLAASVSFNGTVGNGITTPDSAANSIASDIDIRVRAALANWAEPASSQYLMSKTGGASQRAFYFFVGTDGALNFWTSVNGSSLTISSANAATGLANNAVKWVRATWRNSDDRLQFFTSDNGSAWTQLGTNVTHSTTGIFNSSAAVEIGAGAASAVGNMTGKIYYAELRDGIDGTVVQSFTPSAVAVLGTRDPSTVAAGGPWTLNGSAWDWSLT